MLLDQWLVPWDAGVGFGLSKLIGMFYKYEFSHADSH
jgi:hypothetical protein